MMMAAMLAQAKFFPRSDTFTLPVYAVCGLTSPFVGKIRPLL
jgi:hypothetical protein